MRRDDEDDDDGFAGDDDDDDDDNDDGYSCVAERGLSASFCFFEDVFSF